MQDTELFMELNKQWARKLLTFTAKMTAVAQNYARKKLSKHSRV